VHLLSGDEGHDGRKRHRRQTPRHPVTIRRLDGRISSSRIIPGQNRRLLQSRSGESGGWRAITSRHAGWLMIAGKFRGEQREARGVTVRKQSMSTSLFPLQLTRKADLAIGDLQ